jgi:hypothetical protein
MNRSGIADPFKVTYLPGEQRIQIKVEDAKEVTRSHNSKDKQYTKRKRTKR